MSAHGEEFNFKHHIRVYFVIFGSLAVLTALTVLVSYMHVATRLAVIVALTIATIKASLVAGYFMHLIDEKKIIYSILALTILFFFFMVMIIYSTTGSVLTIFSPEYLH